MKKLGLVGGMGPESTIPYYHDIVYGVKNACGHDYFPELTIESVNLYKVVSLIENREYDVVVEYLAAAVDNLARSGADLAALTANTAHIVFDRLQEISPIPIVSIVESTVEEASRRQYRKVGLLGTIFTMTNGFFIEPFSNAGIEVITPQRDIAEMASNLIYSELERGIVRESTRQTFIDIINEMQRRDHIEAIILGCTELPMLLSENVSPVPCLDTRAIHIRKLVDILTA